MASPPDGQCATPGCSRTVDWRRYEIPPPGWAHVVFGRYNKRGFKSSVTFVLCPDHTVSFTRRQVGLLLEGQMPRRTVVTASVGSAAPHDAYLRTAVEDSLRRKEAPFCSELLYRGKASHDVARARDAWMRQAEAVVLYHDLPLSPPVRQTLERAEQMQLPLERRKINRR